MSFLLLFKMIMRQVILSITHNNVISQTNHGHHPKSQRSRPSTAVSNITLCSHTVASIVATGQNGGAMLSVRQLELHVVPVKSCSETNVCFYAYSIKFTHILQGFFSKMLWRRCLICRLSHFRMDVTWGMCV